jgi:hypothetical protein
MEVTVLLGEEGAVMLVVQQAALVALLVALILAEVTRGIPEQQEAVA